MSLNFGLALMDGFKFRALEFNIRLDSIDWSLVEMCALSANLVFILHGKKNK